MNVIADLHIHSRFSRACSKDLNIKNLEKWSRIKGIDILGTGDFTHPEWMKELKSELKSNESGIHKTKSGFKFLLQVEISQIYTAGGKGRRIHNIILAPDFEIADQVTEYLKTHGRVDYDGRPIFKIPCPDLVENMRKISKDIEVIPAHCLLPKEKIPCYSEVKEISSIKKGDKVLTHKGRFKKVQKIYSRVYKGKVHKIITRYFSLGLETTEEHPFYAIKTLKNCSWTKGICKPTNPHLKYCVTRACDKYKPEWIPANQLSIGDVILYPRLKNIKDKKEINVAGKSKFLDASFCRLIGYYLAEGHVNSRDGFGFTFNKNEKNFIKDVNYLVKKYFGVEPKKGKKEGELVFYSKKIMKFLTSNFYSKGEKRANNKRLPSWTLYLPLNKQAELFKGWWYGDKGYTSSIELLNQMKIICLRLGIIPSIRVDKASDHEKKGKHFIDGRQIKAKYDNYAMGKLSFFEDKFSLANDEHFKKFSERAKFKYGWMDKNYVYLPIRKIEKRNYQGSVYNLEVEKDNSYSSQFACVHNCWTPWFSVFGSKSGFDSVEEAFEDQAKHVHALETGLSSDPEMNRKISGLDKYNLVSFSDSHSYWPWRLGREATVFDVKKLSYQNIIKAIRERENSSSGSSNRIAETIEVDPNYGKYHVDGHRACNVTFEPEESRKNNGICPVCKRPLTLGVLNRVQNLTDRKQSMLNNTPKFRRLLPLSDILSAISGTGVATKKVWELYWPLIKEFNNEFNVLLNAPKEQLEKIALPEVADAIIKNRNGQIKVTPGYDGVYGVPQLGQAKETEVKKINKSQKGLSEFF